jgi:hypothetical protein
MAKENYIEDIFIETINKMKTTEWQFPQHWDKVRKLAFLNNSLDYATKNEYYEQCGVIRDYKRKFEEQEG